MSDVGSLLGLGGSLPAGPEAHPQQRLNQVAQEFESLLIAQLMRGMRESGGAGGWLGCGEDKSSAAISEFAEQMVARTLAASGGLGLASLISQGLRQQEPPVQDQPQKLTDPP
jgi:Rod binding domain-containing protein